MKQNILYLFAAILFVSVGINVIAHLQKLIVFLPESAVFGPQVPYSTPQNMQIEREKYREGRYVNEEKQKRRYSYQNRWENSQPNSSLYTEGRVRKGRYGNN